jgi:hypothetical protein
MCVIFKPLTGKGKFSVPRGTIMALALLAKLEEFQPLPAVTNTSKDRLLRHF